MRSISCSASRKHFDFNSVCISLYIFFSGIAYSHRRQIKNPLEQNIQADLVYALLELEAVLGNVFGDYRENIILIFLLFISCWIEQAFSITLGKDILNIY